jgi:hypothetical protein
LGDLDQDPVGGGEVVWVQVGVQAVGQGGDGVGQSGVEGGTFGGELDGPAPRSLGEVAEGLRRWQDDEIDADLAPGEFQTDAAMPNLGVALQWSAAAIGSGMLGNYAYDLLKPLLHS